MIYVCIPCYNEAPTVGLVLWKVRQVFTAFAREYHILACDDASSDGTGETLASYDDPGRAGRGDSLPSQTAWALLALFAVGHTQGPEVESGIRFLIGTQSSDGTWEDPRWNGTGFPRVFYLRYHFYAKYFPLWALGVYRSARS